MDASNQGLVHRVRHQVVDVSTERLVGKPKKLLTIDGDLLELKIRTIHHEQGVFDPSGSYILAVGEVLDRGCRFNRYGTSIAHGAFAFSTQEHQPRSDFWFCLGVLKIWVGDPRDGWMDGSDKDRLFQELAVYEERFKKPLFQRLTGLEPERHHEKGAQSRFADMGAKMFSLVSMRSSR